MNEYSLKRLCWAYGCAKKGSQEEESFLREIVRRIAGAAESSPTIVAPVTLEQLRRDHILRVLEQCGGSISRAAQQLGIYRSSLQRALRRIRRTVPDLVADAAGD